jgi:D-threonate/D-erythronate kinase
LTILRIVADDLTGALDSAAPLARRAGALPVFWDQAAIAGGAGSFALDTDSREAPRAAAEWLPALCGADLAYKKIDSLLRGNTAREIGACLASDWFRSAVIAPAFPAQQRITRAGRQYWRADPFERWQLVACDLAATLRSEGLELRLAPSAAAVVGSGFFLCDAATEADLGELAATGERLAPPILWCGSAGLARALAGAPPVSATPPLAPPLLLVIGSHHPVTLAQIEALARHAPEVVTRVRPTEPETIARLLRRVAAALAGGGAAALVIEVADGTGAELAAPLFDRVLSAAAACLERPRSLVVTGGATLHRLVAVLGTRSLLVNGEPLPGVPRSEFQGGLWDGADVISKSGAFGDPSLLIRLVQPAMGGNHE